MIGGRKARLDARRRRLAATCARTSCARSAGRSRALCAAGSVARARHLGRDRAGHAADGNAGAPDGDGGAAGRVRGRAGAALRRVRGPARRARRQTAQVLLTFFDVSARMQYLNARRTLGKLIDWGVVPVDQRERHHRDRRDQLRRQRHPRGAGRDPAAGRPAGRAVGRGRALHERPARATRTPSGSRRCATSPSCASYEIGMSQLASGLGRACAARCSRPRWRPRPAIPVVICNGTEPGRSSARVAGEPVGTRFQPQAAARIELQAVAASTPRPSSGRVLVDEGAERALREQGTSLLPVGVVDVEGDFEAGDAVDVAPPATAGARSARGSRTTRRPSCAGSRA